MPKVKKGNKYQKEYTEKQLEDAVHAVKNGMSKHKASKMYAVPRTTILYRLSNAFVKASPGPNPVLGRRGEDDLVSWIINCQRRGFPRRKINIQARVKEFLDHTKIKNPFRDNVPGDKWYKALFKRNPILAERFPEGVTSSGSCDMNKRNVKNTRLQPPAGGNNVKRKKPNGSKVRANINDLPTHEVKQDNEKEDPVNDILESYTDSEAGPLFTTQDDVSMTFKSGLTPTLCRACLKDDISPMFPLSSMVKVDATSIVLSEILQSITKKPVDIRNEIPSVVCMDCVERIISAHLFVMQYESSQEKLKENYTNLPPSKSADVVDDNTINSEYSIDIKCIVPVVESLTTESNVCTNTPKSSVDSVGLQNGVGSLKQVDPKPALTTANTKITSNGANISPTPRSINCDECKVTLLKSEIAEHMANCKMKDKLLKTPNSKCQVLICKHCDTLVYLFEMKNHTDKCVKIAKERLKNSLLLSSSIKPPDAESRKEIFTKMMPSDQKLFCCDVCYTVHDSENDLNIHIKLHKEQQQKEHHIKSAQKCDICDLYFPNTDRLLRHIKRHTGNSQA